MLMGIRIKYFQVASSQGTFEYLTELNSIFEWKRRIQNDDERWLWIVLILKWGCVVHIVRRRTQRRQGCVELSILSSHVRYRKNEDMPHANSAQNMIHGFESWGERAAEKCCFVFVFSQDKTRQDT